MKVLLDPIYTSDPGHCASAVKMRDIVERELARTEDVFFYWLIPEWCTEEQLEWFPKNDRIRYIPHPYNKYDRMKEYLRLHPKIEHLIRFDCEAFDVDIVITNRTSMVPAYKALMNKPGRETMLWSKKVFLIEDMPVMSYKKLVPICHPYTQDLMALAGYLSADSVAISSYWQKDVIVEEGKKHLSPASVRRLMDNIHEASSILLSKVTHKSKKVVQALLDGDRDFTIGYIGRMVGSQTRTEDIFGVMTKNWVWPKNGRHIRCIISTVSMSEGRVEVPDFIDLHRPSREGFWKLARDEMDVFIFMSKEEDYSMSLMEPLILGTPAILIRDRWSVGTVGEDYPFFVSGVREAYALVRQFQDNYPEMYKKFVIWQREWLQPTLEKRAEMSTYNVYRALVDKYEEDFEAYRKANPGHAENAIIKEFLSQDEFVLEEYLKKLGAEGRLEWLHTKFGERFKENTKITYGSDWNLYRLGLLAFHGYRDASTRSGHFTRLPKASESP